MNYRHHFHAGNFADVMKHALLMQLVRGLQKKEKGFLYLDTHAGRGGYDLDAAATGDSLARKPEWPDGVGRLLGRVSLLPVLTEYLDLAQKFDASRRSGAADIAGTGEGSTRTLKYYPGSPWFVRELARPQDRLALCEKQPEECVALRELFQFSPRTLVQETDGYAAVRAMLPPLERRALILIDPPFEAQDEFTQVLAALGEGLRRFPSGVFAVWYPLTERARVDTFFAGLRDLKPPATLTAELLVAGAESPIKVKGCGLLVINPPWQFDREVATMLEFLGRSLAQAPGGYGRVTWLVED
jgi:23S rRNA (adenine2030-N6)-methyltransferase